MNSSGVADEEEVSKLELANLEEALEFVKADASKLLRDLLSGISMWGLTALMAFVLAAVWLGLAEVILTYAHPYGALPQVLDTLYISYLFATASAILGLVLIWRYYSLRKKYSRLFEIAGKLR